MSNVAILKPFLTKDNIVLNIGNVHDVSTSTVLTVREDRLRVPYGRRELDLVGVEGWETIELDANFAVPLEELSELLDEEEDPFNVVRGLISVRCAPSKLRQGYELQYDGDGSWYGKVRIHRADVAGDVELVPEVVRVTEHSGDDHSANFIGAIVATGDPVGLVIDEAITAYSGPLRYHFEEFSKSGNEWVRTHAKDLYYLNPSDVPELYINIEYRSVQPALDSKAYSGPQASLRYTYAAGILQAAWTQMYVTAAGSIEYDEETERYIPPVGWRGKMAEVLAYELYPDDDEQGGLMKIYQEFRGADSLAMLIGQLGTLAQRQSELGTYFDKAARALAAVSTAELQAVENE